MCKPPPLGQANELSTAESSGSRIYEIPPGGAMTSKINPFISTPSVFVFFPSFKAFMPQPDDTSECVSHQATAFTPLSHSYSVSAEPSEWHVSADLQPFCLESLLDHTSPEEEEESSQRSLSEHTNAGLKRQVWPSDTDSNSADRPAECPDKKSRLDQDVHEQSERHFSERLGSETVQVFGSFRGLGVLKAMPSANSDPWRDGRCTFFQTSVREHSTVRTRVFPHGKAFTSHTPDGGCRFLWIPKQN